MGKSITPKYRIESRDNVGRGDPFAKIVEWDGRDVLISTWVWDSKSYGRANAKNLETWRVKMNQSFNHGGVNYHISQMYKVLVHISHARIVEQKTGKVICSVTMPMFEAV